VRLLPLVNLLNQPVHGVPRKAISWHEYAVGSRGQVIRIVIIAVSVMFPVFDQRA
jgi:hypothetical protein